MVGLLITNVVLLVFCVILLHLSEWPKKHIKYASYIIRHKWYVFRAGLEYKVPLGILILHDLSKLDPREWMPYARFFYADGSQSDFNYAWLLHQKRNKHHWQWWVLMNDTDKPVCLPMPDAYRREMLADWVGASTAIRGYNNTLAWYEENRKKIQLHPETRRWVEARLGFIP